MTAKDSTQHLTASTMSTELVVESGKLEALLPLFGAAVNDEGYIVDIESGEIIESPSGDRLTTDEVGYIGHGSVEPVENDISSIVSYLSNDELWKEN